MLTEDDKKLLRGLLGKLAAERIRLNSATHDAMVASLRLGEAERELADVYRDLSAVLLRFEAGPKPDKS